MLIGSSLKTTRVDAKQQFRDLYHDICCDDDGMGGSPRPFTSRVSLLVLECATSEDSLSHITADMDVHQWHILLRRARPPRLDHCI